MIFSHISWGKYLMVIALIILAYYLVICVKYYGPDILKRFSGKPGDFFAGSKPYPPEGHEGYNKKQTATSAVKEGSDEAPTLEERVAPLLAETADLIQHIKEIISTSMAQNLERTHILGILHTLLKTYPHLRDTRIMTSVNRFVASEFNKYGAFDLRDDELKGLWIL